MQENWMEKNYATVTGEVVSEFVYSHELFGEKFYLLTVSVKRLSSTYDLIPVLVSERMTDVKEDLRGKYMKICGQFRSYNRHEEKKNRLMLSVFARQIGFAEEGEGEEDGSSNQIYLEGNLCKEPVFRRTPLGREITDLLLAVNRSYGKSDYIPCICWGRNARYISAYPVGSPIRIRGRIQSREYVKRLDRETLERHLAYEVSVAWIENAEM